jgi:hypothetical protein
LLSDIRGCTSQHEALAVIGVDTIVFTGRVAPTFNNYSQVSNMGLENGTKFACIPPPFVGWPISLCQLDQSNNHWPGQLVSPFRPPSAARQYEKNGNPRFGTAYMAMNISDGSYPDLRKVSNAGENIAGRPEVPPVRPVSYSENGEWQDLVFSRDSTSVRISVTICYSSFDSADLIITARRKSVGLEPSRQYTPDAGFTYNAVRQQLGLANLPEDAKPSMEQRGILALGKRDSWLPGENESTTPSGRGSPDEPITYIAGISSMSGPYAGPGGDNYTAILSSALHRPIMQYGFSGGGNVTAFSPDKFTTGLFQEILRHNFCIASAVQSVITTLAGIVYYSQLPMFDEIQVISSTRFTEALAPHTYRGYVAVMVVVLVHMVLIGLIMSLFLASTAVSTLNNAWQTVAQIRGPLVDGYLSKASLAKNSEVEKWLKEGHRERELVGIAVVENGDERAEIVRGTIAC